MMLVDSHCHLDFPNFSGNMPEILANMATHQVSHALCISVNLPDFPNVLALATAYPQLFASVGVHPDYDDTPEPSVDGLIALANHPKVLAIGETGLDYFRLKNDTPTALDWQRERFRTHIRAAVAVDKPLIVHTRDAREDTLRILTEESASRVGGVLHCFTEDVAVAQAAIALGFYISFSGIITFKNAQSLRDVVKALPLDRLLVETDAPYLAPVPNRGKTNQPAWVRHVAACIAEIKGISLEAVAHQTTENFSRLFKVSLTH